MRCPCPVSGAQIYWFFSSVEMQKFMFLGILIGGISLFPLSEQIESGEFRSALKVERGKCCATSFLDLHETFL
jgi:hypothetical protein